MIISSPFGRPAADADDQQWFILGAGAMGCLWAARLWQWSQDSRSSLPVTLLLRNENELTHYQQQQGIILEDAGTITRLPVPTSIIGQTAGPVSHLLLATKAHDTAAALHAADHLIDTRTRLVLLQNGLRQQREISANWGEDRVYCLSTTHGAWRKEPFHVVHAGHGESWLGTLAGETGEALLQLMPTTAMSLHGDHDISTRLWRKFAINCAVNALTVIHNCRNGELLTLPAARADLTALCAEITDIYAKLPEAPAFPDLQDQVSEVLGRTADNFSSTLQDVRQGRPTEVPDLNGYLCELAHTCGIDCRVNEDTIRQLRLEHPV